MKIHKLTKKELLADIKATEEIIRMIDRKIFKLMLERNKNKK